MNVDGRLIGRTAENLFLSLLNQRGIFATSFDTEGFDGIIYDHNHRMFTGGKAPYYTQIKCRGSQTKSFNSQGHDESVITKIRTMADDLKIGEGSLYLTLGFFRMNDIRTLRFYSIPFTKLGQFKADYSQYRFSVKRCDEALRSTRGMIRM